MADPSAFREIFDECKLRVLAFAIRRVGDHSTAEDICSETFLRAWRNTSAIPHPPLPWLIGIARNVISEQYRAQTRDQSLIHKVGEELIVSAAPANSSHSDVVAIAFAKLSDADQEILTLRAWDDLDVDEIAVVLKISSATARVRLHRARGRLKKTMEMVR